MTTSRLNSSKNPLFAERLRFFATIAYSFAELASVSGPSGDGFATAGGRKSASVSGGAFFGRMHRTWPLCDTTITASVQTL